MHRMNHECLLCSEGSILAWNGGSCWPMQSGTDGLVGGWVLSAHRSSCGSAVPLLFTTRARTGHVRHLPWRRTRAGSWSCASILALALHYWLYRKENVDAGIWLFVRQRCEIGGLNKARSCACNLLMEQLWIA